MYTRTPGVHDGKVNHSLHGRVLSDSAGSLYIPSQIINSYYSNLVNIVYSFGGDIIKIAGDALYCIFMPDEHDIRGAVLCTALCSMQLRDVSTTNKLSLDVS